MRPRLALLVACVLALPACTWEAGRAWQRNECLRQPSPDAQRRCEEGMKMRQSAPERKVVQQA